MRFIKETKIYNQFNQLHSENEPSLIVYNTNLKYTIKQVYYKNGQKHSYNDIPSVIKNNYNDEPKIFKYHKEGVLHRDENLGPSFIEFDLFQRKICEKYYKDGMLHRENEPAIIYYFYQDDDLNENDSTLEWWYINNSPTKSIMKNEKGEIINETYYQYNVYHHLDKPAYQNQYFIFGRNISKKNLFKTKNVIRKGIRKHKQNLLSSFLDTKNLIRNKSLNKVIKKLTY